MIDYKHTSYHKILKNKLPDNHWWIQGVPGVDPEPNFEKFVKIGKN
jgi:hypothetical protein